MVTMGADGNPLSGEEHHADSEGSGSDQLKELLEKLCQDPQVAAISPILKPLMASHLANTKQQSGFALQMEKALALIQQQASLFIQLKEQVDGAAPETEQAHKFKNTAYARHGMLAFETLSVGKGLKDALESLLNGVPPPAAKLDGLLARLTSLLDKQQESYEFYVVADVDGPKVAQQMSSSVELTGFSEEFSRKRKAALEAVKAEDKELAKKAKEEKPKEDKKAAPRAPFYGNPYGSFSQLGRARPPGGPLNCFSCGQWGHMAPMCPNAPPQARLPLGGIPPPSSL